MNIESPIESIVAEKIGCESQEVDESCVSHVLETWGVAVFPDDRVKKLLAQRSDGKIKAVYRIGRTHYRQTAYHGFEDSNWRHLPPSMALDQLEDMLEDDEEETETAVDELAARPDDSDSIEDLLLELDE